MKKLLSMLLAIMMLMTTALAADVPQNDYPQRFGDVPKEYWAYEYIEELALNGVINGYEDGTYLPEKQVTRAEWATMLSNTISKEDHPNEVMLPDDLDAEAWWTPYLKNVYRYFPPRKEMRNGVETLFYRPSELATREDVTASIIRVINYDLSEADTSLLSSFTDSVTIAQENQAYVALAIEKGLINGFEDQTFRGRNALTRAQAATILVKATKLYKSFHYIGEKENGVPNGQGKCKFINGSSYEGEWKDGTPNGYGTAYFASGNQYTEEWKDNNPNGKGTYLWVNGDRYEGNMKDGRASGYGVIYWSNGDRYEGEWINGKRTGYANYYMSNGDFYEGNFESGKFHGNGTYYWADGDKYTGQWQYDKQHGYGTYYFKSGDYYEGEWQADFKCGYGIYYFSYGDWYEGDFKNDKRNGYGTYHFADGRYLAGNWIDDEFVG